jgi:translation initiation factor eIF-2B subunit delta
LKKQLQNVKNKSVKCFREKIGKKENIYLSIPKEAYEIIKRIREDKVSGASQLTALSLEALKSTLKNFSGEKFEELFGSLRTTARLLTEAKPTMPSIANISNKLLWRIREKPRKLGRFSLREAKRLCEEELLKIALEYREKLGKTAENGSKLISEDDSIATCSYSSIIIEAFRIAKNEELRFKVLAASSISGSISHGLNLAEKLSQLGVKVQVYPDSMIGEMVKEASMVMLGADAILPDGSIINGEPSLRLALEAKQKAKPLYVVCDSMKISPVKIPIQEGFDLVNKDLIKNLVMEDGKIKPSSIVDKVKETAEWRQIPSLDTY